MNPRLIVTVALLAGANLVHAQTCQTASIPASTPTSQFVINAAQGTVLDKKTGLMWKRCAEGVSGINCSDGSTAFFDWSGALTQAKNSRHAGYSDWRVPNLKELRSIVEEQCVEPAINTAVFPNVPSDSFWAASPYAYDSDSAWLVDFYDGDSYGYYRSARNANYHTHAVRLVRSGQ